MVTIAQLIAAQDKPRAARAALLASAPDSPAERRALLRSLRADRVCGRCLDTYVAQRGMGRELFAHSAAEREALAGRAAA